MASDYISNMASEEVKRFNQHQREQQLDQIINQFNGSIPALMKSDIYLSADDISYLNKVQEEQTLQEKHDEAFLRGFQTGGR